MGFGAPGGSRSGGRGGLAPQQWRTIIIVVAIAVFAILVRTGRITRFELIYFCVLVPSIILHEISHGVVALACGDDTAKRAGRLTLNPVPHIDLVGTIIVPALLTLGGATVHGFSVALIVGVIVATYSSIYVSTNLAVALGISREDLLPAKEKEIDELP